MTMATNTTLVDQPLPRLDVRVRSGRPMELRIGLADGNGDPLAAGAVTSARAEVRSTIDDPTVWHTFSTADNTIGVVDGFATLLATSDETTEWANLWPGSAPETIMWWDLEITDEDGETWQMTDPGQLIVVHQVTR